MLTAILAAIVLSLILVGALVLVLPRLLERNSQEMLARFEAEREMRERDLELRLRDSQSAVAKEQTESFLNLAQTHLKQQTEMGEQQLKARQEAIDKQLEGIGKELKSVQEYVAKNDKAQNQTMTEIASAVKHSTQATQLLQRDTQKLSEALAGGQSRGQWGERVAEDVLRACGFIEGVNYEKQQITAGGSRPDYTFLLPDKRRLNMDVKAPMAAFNRYLEAETDGERDAAAKDFLRDTRNRIKEVTTRDYINPEEGTLDYTLVFIPNEQVYGFIHEQDASVVDFALANRVVICSPLTLFAVLAVIRQSADNFRLETKTREIQAAIAVFADQWERYKAQMVKVGNAIESTGRNWEDLTGARERQLDRSIAKIEELRSGTEAGLGAPAPENDAPVLEPDVIELQPTLQAIDES